MLKGKNIVVGITGSIAAYKSCDLIRKLVKLQANVICVMTKSAKHFITPLTLQTISGNQVMEDLFQKPLNWQVNHISLAKRADLVLIAPATADIIGKLAGGLADDLLTSSVLATHAPILICSSMNENMYRNVVVQENIKKLKDRGFIFVGPSVGDLVCGTEGIGRLSEVDEIIGEVMRIFRESKIEKRDLKGKNILITAGPTQEYLDPVRFISNPSSGRMGYALAEESQLRGAKVILITGPTYLIPPEQVKTIYIKNAFEMEREVKKYFSRVDIVIGAAAVSDWRPEKRELKKMKKEGRISISLVRTADILAGLGRKKGNKILIGFAAETDHLQKNAWDKLVKKNLDFIVVNKVKESFGKQTNKVTIIDKQNNKKNYPPMDKRKIASLILDKVLDFLPLKNSSSA